MLSKEDLARKHHFVQTGLSVGKSQSHADVTLDYAKQVAISFAEWIDKGWESVRLGEYQGKYSGEIKTTAELYTLFLTHQSI